MLIWDEPSTFDSHSDLFLRPLPLCLFHRDTRLAPVVSLAVSLETFSRLSACTLDSFLNSGVNCDECDIFVNSALTIGTKLEDGIVNTE